VVGRGITALVMKLIFNRITNRFPLVVFDESLSFLADKYIDPASQFIKQMTAEFKMPLILVTHQPRFTAYADYTYTAARKNDTTVQFTRSIGKV
jgi:ABC-type lipoprotein export system ATPase subunit